jgi:maltooligosyltrehalose trehalohydrolase
MWAMTALLLLGPWIPMLFQGQEFGSSKPFLFFADHGGDLAVQVQDGRREFMRQFRCTRDPEVSLAPPHDRDTFERSALDDGERNGNAWHIALHRDLIALRTTDRVIGSPGKTLDATALDSDRLLLRYRGADADRLLVVNLGNTFDLARAADPLVAPTARGPWRVSWHSERVAYRGTGLPPLEPKRWDIPGHSAVLLGDIL